MLSKFSAQIGPNPNVLCSIEQFDRSDRVNGKRPYVNTIIVQLNLMHYLFIY
jgi:hypothetical protein